MTHNLTATQAAPSRAYLMAERLTSPLLQQARKSQHNHSPTHPKPKIRTSKHRKFIHPGLSFQGMKNDTQRRESITAVVGQFVGMCSATHRIPVFVDAHAGSGYISHNLHHFFPSLVIIANDYDDNKGTRYHHAEITEQIRQEIVHHFPDNIEHPTTEQIQQLREILNTHASNGEFLDLLTFSRWFNRDIFGRITDTLDGINRIHPIHRKLPTARILHYFDGFHLLPEDLKDASNYAQFIQSVKDYAIAHKTELLQQLRGAQLRLPTPPNESQPFAFFFFFDPPYCSTNCADYHSQTMAGINTTRTNWETITGTLDAFGYFNSETISEELTHDIPNLQIEHFATRAGYGHTRDFFAYRLPQP